MTLGPSGNGTRREKEKKRGEEPPRKNQHHCPTGQARAGNEAAAITRSDEFPTAFVDPAKRALVLDWGPTA